MKNIRAGKNVAQEMINSYPEHTNEFFNLVIVIQY